MTTPRRTSRTSAKNPGFQDGTNEPTAPSAELRTECQRLQERVRQLEEELAALRTERDDYRRAVYAYLRQESPEEDWRDFREEDYTLPAEQVLAELAKRRGQ